MAILETILQVIHLFVCAMLILVVLLQQGKGGGMGAAFGGGGAGGQVFGGRGAGTLLTRATSVFAAVFMLTSVSLAYLSSSGDRALKARAAIAAEKQEDKGEKGTPREKTPEAPKPTETGMAPTPGPTSQAPTNNTSTPTEGTTPSPK